MKKEFEAVVYGEVQGVFFRDYTRQTARNLHLTGWVRNEPDGAVRVVAQGEEEKLAALLGYLQEGSPPARVEKVDVKWRELSECFDGFEIVG
jgi:acylphosphatase